MAGPKQTNFGGGELSPLLWGRTDLPIFGKGCRTLRNFVPTRQGAAVSRPGTTLVKETKTATEMGLRVDLLNRVFYVRLVPFNAGEEDSFCLEFGIGYIRFHRNGGTVDSPAGSGTPYEVATPYDEDDLRALKWAQVGDVLTLCTPNFDPYELRHVSDAPPNWTFTAAVTAPLPLDGVNVAFYDPGDKSQITSAFYIDSTAGGGQGGAAADEDHPAREWQWMVTAVCRRVADGAMFETLGDLVSESYNPNALDPFDNPTPLTSDVFPIYQDLPVTLRRGELNGLIGFAVPADFDVIAYNFYRGRGKLFGFIGQTTSREFVDVGDEPNYGIQPPIGTDPFGDSTEASGAAAPFNLRHINRPAAVTYFQQRRVFGGFTLDELLLKASATGDFDNFDERILLHVSGESLTFRVAARLRGAVRHLVESDRLLVLTSSCSFHGGGAGQGSPWDFDSVDFRPIEKIGANDVQVLDVEGAVLFVRSKGRGARALLPAGQDAGFKGFDLARFAEHLFRGVEHKIVDWTYAEDPWGVVWAVREDGALLSLTLDREQEMIAWARHDMAHEEGEDADGNAITVTDGTVQSVCAVTEGDEDAVYLVVRRVIGGQTRQYLERMTSRHERGGAVVLIDGTIDTPPDYICVDSAVPYVGAAAQTFTGLGHLEGKSVWLLREGESPVGPFTVVGGQIDVGFEVPANITNEDGAPKLLCYIGLPYLCDLEPLDIAGADARMRMKRVTHVGFEVDQAKGVKVGQSFDELDDQPDREPSDGFGTTDLKTEVLLSPIRGASDLAARCVLRQEFPLPVTVVGLTRKVVAGDDP